MKLPSCSCGSLLMLLLFTLIKTGIGVGMMIHCYETEGCEESISRSEYIRCLKKASGKINEVWCDPAICISITAKAGGEEFKMKGCAYGAGDCDVLKTMMQQDLENFYCETCSYDHLCNYDPEMKKAEVKQNTSSSRNGSSCIYLSVFVFSLILSALFL